MCTYTINALINICIKYFQFVFSNYVTFGFNIHFRHLNIWYTNVLGLFLSNDKVILTQVSII